MRCGSKGSVFLCCCLAACSGERPPASCQWPEEAPSALDLGTRRDRAHLHDDALRAEDLAIRHADSLKAPHSGHFEGFESYERTRDTCMAALFGAVARVHGVPLDEVRAALARRPAGPDIAVMLSFAVFYGWVAYVVAGRVRREFPWAGGWDSVAALAATFVAALLVSFLAVLVGEWYSLVIEIFRVGNGHLSYRVQRIPWNHHRAGLFATGVVAFCAVAAVGLARSRRSGDPAR